MGKSDKRCGLVKRPASDWWLISVMTTEVLHQEQGERVPHQVPQPEYLSTGRRAPRKSDFENHWGSHLEEIEIYRNRDFALKNCMQNLTCSEFWHKGSCLKHICVRPTDWSWSLSHRGQRQLEFSLGTKMLEANILDRRCNKSSMYKTNTEIRQHEKTKEYVSNEGKDKNLRKMTKLNRDKQAIQWRVQGIDDKDAYQSCQNNRWTQWEPPWRVRKYKKEQIRAEEYNNWNKNTKSRVD